MKAKLISFVIAGPLRRSSSEASATRAKKTKEAVQSPVVKSAPHYFEATVPQQFIISQNKLTLQGHEGAITLKTYQPDTLLAEARFELDDIFADEVFDIKEDAINQCRELLKKSGAKDVEHYSEEYSLYVVADYSGDPEQFLKNKERVASLLKSEKLALDPLEIDYTLSSQLKYSKNDLVIVDWDGAFVFDPESDIESTVELLELANLQLLRYRLLDAELDSRLELVAKIFESLPEKKRAMMLFGGKEVKNAIKSIMGIRATSLFGFQSLEREIKLIGDWYSARLYELAAKKFKLDEWRAQIKDKLETLEDIYGTVSERFSWSPERIELVGWFVLLIGWAIILVFDLWVAFFKG
ncbi:MAG: hypothetical protein HYW88_03480 [Candidatus Sungbacteria bacterium]|nr:hypothetical protein [Candidatus Sungbacteria bacterium]